MRPSAKGWLKKYLEMRGELLKDLISKEDRRSSHPEQSLYRTIQPTGLMYGQSVIDVSIRELDHWSEKDRMKILLAESLISSSILSYRKSIQSIDEISDIISKTLDSIGNFYNNIFPEIATSEKTLFGKRKSSVEIVERILDKRIELTHEHQGNFWVYFFHNSLLFLDVFIFGQWIHTNADRIVADFFRYEREELRFSVVKVIAAAAFANNEVAFEEKRLFEYFLQGTDLSSEKRKESLKIFEKGIEIENINIPSENSWILKKFFLEIAILTMWADKKVEQTELDFIKDFSKYLKFTEDDLENSMIAIEGFVLEQWEQLEFLQNKQEYNQVSEQFIKRLSRIIEKNKNQLIRELHENKEILTLLDKARSNELTLEEAELMRTGLVDLIKTIPTFVVISLPQQFLTLPVLLKVLPKEIFIES